MCRRTATRASVRSSFQAQCTAWRLTCTRCSSPRPDRAPPGRASTEEVAPQAEASPEAASAAAAAAPSNSCGDGRPARPPGGDARLSIGKPPHLARNRFFQPALFRRLIGSKPHEHRRPQLHPAFRGFVSPLGKLNFGDKFGTHELNFSQSADLAVKRILFRVERLQASKDFFERLLIEAGAHLADVNEAPLLVVQAEHERTEIFAAALRIGIASDDALLTLRDFDFEPIARALFFVSAAALLGNDAFQSALFCRFEKIKTLFGIVVGKVHYIAPASNNPFLQQLLALMERDAAQVEPIEIEQVECVVDDRHTFAPWQASLSRLESRALLQQAERGAPLPIERDDLSVEDGALGFYELRQASEFRKLCGEIILTARHQTHAAVFDEGDGAVAVPFNLEQPVRIVESLGGGGRQHRVDDRGHGLLLHAR